MTKVTKFPSFVSSYRYLEENKEEVTLVEFYHHEMPSEPSVSVVDHINEVLVGEIDNSKHIVVRLDGGTDLSFDEENYHTNISNGAVIFSSKHDNETYCIIDFMERK